MSLKNEPVIVAVLAWVTATVALLVAFGVHVTPEQREAIEAWVGATIVGALLVRSRVLPLLKHEAAQPAPEHVAAARAILAGHVAAQNEAKVAAAPTVAAVEALSTPAPAGGGADASAA